MALSDREQAILDFARWSWTATGPKEARIKQQLQLSPTRYYQLLNELIDSDDALAYDPLGVRRLRRQREQRRRARYERTSTEERRGR